MKGAIIGNIIGVPHEFKGNRDKYFEPLIPNNIGMDDDSLLTIATAYALQKDKDYASSYRKFCSKYPNLPYGARFNQWLGNPNAKAYNSKGNGAAMRVSPVAWFYDLLDDVLIEAENSAKVTHNHPEGILSAKLVAHSIFICRMGATKNDISDLVNIYDLKLHSSVDELRKIYQYTELALETVLPAITCFINSDNFEDSIRNACSIGGDADTLAAITGSIAEAYYGTPKDLWEMIKSFLPSDYLKIINEF